MPTEEEINANWASLLPSLLTVPAAGTHRYSYIDENGGCVFVADATTRAEFERRLGCPQRTAERLEAAFDAASKAVEAARKAFVASRRRNNPNGAQARLEGRMAEPFTSDKPISVHAGINAMRLRYIAQEENNPTLSQDAFLARCVNNDEDERVVTLGDLRVCRNLLGAMFELLHEDRCCPGAELMVSVEGTERNITKEALALIDHLDMLTTQERLDAAYTLRRDTRAQLLHDLGQLHPVPEVERQMAAWDAANPEGRRWA